LEEQGEHRWVKGDQGKIAKGGTIKREKKGEEVILNNSSA